MTKLDKPVARKACAFHREMVVTLYPNSTLGMRESGCSTEYRLPLETIFRMAVEAQRATRKAARKAVKGGR